MYLDSFPYAACSSLPLVFESNLRAISLKGSNQRSRQGAYWTEKQGLPSPTSKLEYVRNALDFIDTDKPNLDSSMFFCNYFKSNILNSYFEELGR